MRTAGEGEVVGKGWAGAAEEVGGGEEVGKVAEDGGFWGKMVDGLRVGGLVTGGC